MLLVILVLLILFGTGGGYYGYNRWGPMGGGSFLGTALLVLLVLYLLGYLRR